MTAIDEFATIIPTLGPPEHVRPVPQQRIDQYRGRLPEGMLRFWQQVGWCSFLNGYYWVCDPDDFAPALERVLEGDPDLKARDYALFLHDAFGNLTGWNPATKLLSFNLPSALPAILVDGAESLRDVNTGEMWTDDKAVANAIRLAKASLEYTAANKTEDFLPAVEAVGPLQQGEIYTYVPPFVLGGNGEVNTIRRAQAREHMLFLADIVEVQLERYIMDVNDPANPYGRLETIRPVGRSRSR